MKYIATMTSTHNGKLLVEGEKFEAYDKRFNDFDINCLLNNGRIRVDTSDTVKEPTVEEKMSEETPVVVEVEEKVEEVTEDKPDEVTDDKNDATDDEAVEDKPKSKKKKK